MSFRFQYISSVLLSLMGGYFLSSCTDDVLPNGGEIPGLEADGETLALTISLQSMTRAGETKSDCEKYEDYVDPKKINLLFIYADPDPENSTQKKYDTVIRQYSADQLSLIPIETTTTGELKDWYVKLPILDESDGFANLLRNHDFKVAALVNWQEGKIDEIKDAIITDGEITTPGSHISVLHHLANDNTYADATYSFLMEGTGKMGMTMDWVENGFSSKNDCRSWIRENSYPGKNIYTPDADKYSENFYKDLRLVWNFNAAYKYKDGETYVSDQAYNEYNNANVKEWAKKNHDDLYNWLNESNETTKLNNLPPVTTDNGNFEFVGAAEGSGAYLGTKSGENRVGVVLPPQGNVRENEFRLDFVASGTIYIQWEPIDPDAEIWMERRNHLEDGSPTSKYNLINKDEKEPLEIDDEKGSRELNEMKVSGDSEYINIYAKNGRAIIYEIEYIQDKYLYETCRLGVEVSRENPIAMYGIQKYKQIGTFWKPGMLFNLSDFNNLSLYEEPKYQGYNKIYLMRSVAKVELRIPKTFNAHNVFLRCSNRRTRFEPMDVSTPTDQIWADHIKAEYPLDKDECEWFKLIGHVPFYKNNKESKYGYKEQLAWYYGSWGKLIGEKNKFIGGIEVPEESYGAREIDIEKEHPQKYPRVLNPRIDRSDFTRFIKVGDAEGIYTKYILYVPEKFVDDPNTKGSLTSSPKVAHIEFRRGEGMNLPADPSTNIDDNYCYRIYFTENGFYSNGGANQYPSFKKKVEARDEHGNPTKYGDYITWENHYENNIENLKHHWPIMRNHIYSFTVEDADNKVIVLKLEVLPWQNVTVNNNYSW